MSYITLIKLFAIFFIILSLMINELNKTVVEPLSTKVSVGDVFLKVAVFYKMAFAAFLTSGGYFIYKLLTDDDSLHSIEVLITGFIVLISAILSEIWEKIYVTELNEHLNKFHGGKS